MTSGLRSVRDKTLTYIDERLRAESVSGEAVARDRLYQFANLFGEQLRRVKQEDGPALTQTNHIFNLHAIIGGRLAADPSPQLYYVFPEGNWVEVAPDSPYFIIGRTYYGKPVLDRLLTSETSLRLAIALALLAFDATRRSVTDVDFPVDFAVLADVDSKPKFYRYTEVDLAQTIEFWNTGLRDTLHNLPKEWTYPLLPLRKMNP